MLMCYCFFNIPDNGIVFFENLCNSLIFSNFIENLILKSYEENNKRQRDRKAEKAGIKTEIREREP